METKEKTWGKIKRWFKDHKTEIIIGTIAITGFVGGVLFSIKRKKEDEINEIDTDSFSWDGSGDRYVVDAETLNKLPAGKYDVFDTYVNDRVDFVVEEPTGTEG